MAETNSSPINDIFEAIAIDDEGRACRDIPDSACREEAGNFFRHVASLSLTKTGDGLIDPKLVLSWLLTSLGAPAVLIGALVPVREAGALLPQIFTASALRRLPRRKWAWAAGAVVQGLAVLAIAFAALSLEGAVAGGVIVGALTVFALARSVASVTYKDVLGKTVDKSRRGRATGLASSVAAIGTLVFAALLFFKFAPRMELVIGGLFIAAGAWVLAAFLFTGLKEEAGATEGSRNAFKEAIASLDYLKKDQQLRRFIAARGLLTATALAPPFMIAAASAKQAYEGLGLLVFASAGASLTSSFFWGSLADRSSRKVLVFSALAGAVSLGLTAVLGFMGMLNSTFILPGLLFVMMIAYQGVRLGRSTHLVDMADEETRAPYTALSNTAIGILLIAGGAFGVLASVTSPEFVVAVMAGMSLLATPVAMGLEEVQR